ncbi:MAG: TetR family transcriptional regulator [Pseudoruegeria sp.]
MARKSGTRAEDTGAKIRATALELFSEHGFDAVSMRQMAGAVGVQAGAIYLHTKDKQTLLCALMVDFLEARQLAVKALDLSGSPNASMKSFVHFHIDFHRAHAVADQLVRNEARALSPENAAIVADYARQYEDVLNGLLELGREADAFHVPDVSLISQAILTLLSGIEPWRHQHSSFETEKLSRIYENMVRRILKS